MKKFWAKVFDYIIFMLVDACFKQIKNIYYWRGFVALMAQLSFIYRDFGFGMFIISFRQVVHVGLRRGGGGGTPGRVADPANG